MKIILGSKSPRRKDILSLMGYDFDKISYEINSSKVSLGNVFEINDKKIIKSSPNIIDLIEVGDYVNGNKVDFTNGDNKLSYEDKCIGFYDGDGDIILFGNDIKSIVTKEQFKEMEYKIK